MTEPSLERIRSLEQRLAKEPQSPLFARLADAYLLAGRANDALRLCDDGLALYPYYTTAHLIKAKVLLQLGMTAEARHAYEVVREFLPTNASVLHLTSIVDRAPSQRDEAVETAVEEPVEAKPPQVAMQESVHEVIVAEEPQPAPIEEPQSVPVEDARPQEQAAIEESTLQTEEPTVREFSVEEPQQAAISETDEQFGFGEQPIAAPQTEEPGAAEKPELEVQPDAQQPYADFDFGAPPAQPQAAAVEETPFGSQPIEEPAHPTEPEPLQEASPVEAPALEATAQVSTPTPVASPDSSEAATSDWFEAFSQLQQPEIQATEASALAPAPDEENPFAVFGTEQTSETVEGEPYDEFTARARMELFGTEDTLTLDEYLAQTGSADPSAAPPDDIGELAQKLKTSQRITPPVINFSEKAPRTANEVEAGGGSGFVTPTLAEIYVKQGWFDDAIKAYRALAANKPAEKEKFEQRIAEIEEMKKK